MSGVRDPAAFTVAFAAAFSSGDIDSVLRMYEADAVLQSHDGKRHEGLAAIAQALGPILGHGLRMETSTRFLIENGDLALLRNDFSLVDGSGARVHTSSSCELLRRTSDGDWRLLIDVPAGTNA